MATWHGLQQKQNYFVLDASGFANTQQGTFKYCNLAAKAETKATTLIISPNGRARFPKASDPVYLCSFFPHAWMFSISPLDAPRE